MIFKYIEEKTVNLLKANEMFKAGVDVKKLAKAIGIELIEEDFKNDVSGLFVISNDKQIISYNKNEPKTRQRFTIAHEIGHFILHSKEQPIFIDKTPKVMFRNTASTTGEVLKEREANAFAASLLMPMELVISEVKNVPEGSDAIVYLAEKFNVSEQAMSFRLSNMGYDIG